MHKMGWRRRSRLVWLRIRPRVSQFAGTVRSVTLDVIGFAFLTASAFAWCQIAGLATIGVSSFALQWRLRE